MSDLITRVSNVIADLVNDEAAFTILDISEAVKKDGDGFVRHREVQAVARPILDSLLGLFDSQCSYTSTDIMVNTAKGVADARLYHPTWFDADDYTNRNQVASAPAASDDDDLGDDLVQQVVEEEEDDDLDFDDDDFDINKKPTPKASVDDEEKEEDDDEFDASDRFPGAHTINIVQPRSYDGRIEIPKAALEEAGLLNEDVGISFHPNSVGISKGSFAGDAFTTAKAGWRLGKGQLGRSNLENKAVIIATFTDKIVIAKANDTDTCCKDGNTDGCCGTRTPCCKTSKTDCQVAKTIIELAKALADLELSDKDITLEDDFNDVGFDSLDIAELMMVIEDEFGISLDNEDFTNAQTLRDLVHIVQKLV